MKGRENSLFFGSLSIIISLEGSNKSETCFFIGPKGGVGNYLEPKTTQNPNFWLFNVLDFVLKIHWTFYSMNLLLMIASVLLEMENCRCGL